MNKWFKFMLNKNKVILINMDLISVIEYTLTSVTIGEFVLDGEEAERFRREFENWNREIEGLVKVR